MFASSIKSQFIFTSQMSTPIIKQIKSHMCHNYYEIQLLMQKI